MGGHGLYLYKGAIVCLGFLTCAQTVYGSIPDTDHVNEPLQSLPEYGSGSSIPPCQFAQPWLILTF